MKKIKTSPYSKGVEPMPQVSDKLVKECIEYIIYKFNADLTKEGKPSAVDVVLFVPSWLNTRLRRIALIDDESKPCEIEMLQWITPQGRATIITLGSWIGDEFSVTAVPMTEFRPYSLRDVPINKED